MSAVVGSLARGASTAVVDVLLSRGPPWTQETGGPDRLVVLLLVLFGLTILLLSVAVLVLWRRQADDPSGTDNTGTDAEQPSEFDRIRQIDAAVSGRLPQQEIVERTDWSEAKVSRVVSRLADEERLKKVRIGRQNYIRVTDREDGSAEEGSEHRSAA